MIKKLKRKFILLSMSSLFLLLSVIVTGMNVINYNSIVQEADLILSFLSQNKGKFPQLDSPLGTNHNNKLPPNFSPELPYEARYFSVLLSNSGNLIQVETSRITSVDTSLAISYGQKAIDSKNSCGFVDKFRFIQTIEHNTFLRITFLDCGRKLDTFYNFLFASIGMSLAGFLVVFCVISFFSGKIIGPIAESYEKQKRFITDAGHEMKTPLTIINANIDLLEMDFGENECLDDIRQQTKRLTTLTKDLSYLARMEESEQAKDILQMIDFSVSTTILETALSFKPLAHAQGKQFFCSIQPHISIHGNDKAIAQLISILMDNAIKYSPEGGWISLQMEQHNKSLQLIVKNTLKTSIPKENLPLIFDRFYRMDSSRNSEIGGYGIGLSIAKAIVLAHGGRIQADMPEELIFQILITLPIPTKSQIP